MKMCQSFKNVGVRVVGTLTLTHMETCVSLLTLGTRLIESNITEEVFWRMLATLDSSD